jgi:exopolyphosphatase/guanosine-5'-triphosphate,3'-diphosphate pyrophosphatase
LLVLDIGGGSLEMAVGIDEVPDAALSLPLGAGRLTRDALASDPPSPTQVKELRRHVRTDIARVLRELSKAGPPDRFVGTSKTLRSLARVAGAARSAEGMYAARSLERKDVTTLVGRLAEMTTVERSRLPGVSVGRASQMLAGAIVADAAMDLLGIERLDICPWALREGVILRRLDWISAG